MRVSIRRGLRVAGASGEVHRLKCRTLGVGDPALRTEDGREPCEGPRPRGVISRGGDGSDRCSLGSAEVAEFLLEPRELQEDRERRLRDARELARAGIFAARAKFVDALELGATRRRLRQPSR